MLVFTSNNTKRLFTFRQRYVYVLHGFLLVSIICYYGVGIIAECNAQKTKCGLFLPRCMHDSQHIYALNFTCPGPDRHDHAWLSLPAGLAQIILAPSIAPSLIGQWFQPLRARNGATWHTVSLAWGDRHGEQPSIKITAWAWTPSKSTVAGRRNRVHKETFPS